MNTDAIPGFALPAVTALLVSALLTPLVRRLAGTLGMVAAVREDRWHTGRVPILGGVAVAIATVCSTLLWAGPEPGVWLWLLAGSLLFVVGLTDDFVRLKPSTKLTAQIACACLIVLVIPVPQWVGSPGIDTVLAILWVVGVTNALNLLDNMDGLCAGIAAIAAIAYSAGLGGADPGALAFAAALAGACTGFLFYNFHPASIFLGDSGSLFVGSSLAALSLGAGRTEGRGGLMSSMAVPVLLMLIPIFDTTFVTISRKLAARPASRGGRDHTSHRLVALGFSERQAVLLWYGFAAAAGSVAVLFARASTPGPNILIALLVVALVMLAVRLGRVMVYDGADYALLRRARYTPSGDLMHQRRMIEVLLDLWLVTVAHYVTYVIRLDRPTISYEQLEQSLPIVIAAQLVMFFVLGLYRGAWHPVSIADLPKFATAVAGGSIASVIAVVYLYRIEAYSAGTFAVNCLILTLLIAGSRASFRVFGALVGQRGAGRPANAWRRQPRAESHLRNDSPLL
jgi:UDP-GlcNAc:undecaprenyl-phosphate/decaprenyl-phosphate GlcNAc-1-phosphate transferase